MNDDDTIDDRNNESEDADENDNNDDREMRVALTWTNKG